jgi:4-hydroxybenzoyl-CoA reductase subunit beta
MSMLLPDFRLLQPKNLQELEKMLRDFPEADFIAGGSDLLPNYKCGLNAKNEVISLVHIEELKNLSCRKFGSSVTLSRLEKHAESRRDFPVIAETVRQLASPLIRRQATIGGNLHLDTRCHFFNQSAFWRKTLGYCLKAEGDRCHVVPHIKENGKSVVNNKVCYATNCSDLAPVFMVLEADLDYLTVEGPRRLALRDLYCHDGIRRMNKKHNEVLLSVSLPESSGALKAAYRKLRVREAWDFPVLGVAAAVELDDASKLKRFHLCVNAVDTHPLMMDELTQKYLGENLSRVAISALAEELQRSIQPKLNVPMAPGYRKKMSRVLTERLLCDLLSLS